MSTKAMLRSLLSRRLDEEDDDDEEDAVAVGWSPIWVTLIVSFAQGFIFFLFFLNRRKSEKASGKLDVYEKRRLTRAHRTPPAWGGGDDVMTAKSASSEGIPTGAEAASRPKRTFGTGMFGWARAVLSTSDNELLRCVGLDSYMYLRFLRLGFRVTLIGAVLGCCLLIPLYGTGDNEGTDTEQFNSVTMANLEAGSDRLWAPAVIWILFVMYVLYDVWTEWEHYAVRRSEFLAKGDVDTAPDFRYAVIVENIPKELRGNDRLRHYFERLFPHQVRQVNVCLDTSKLDKLVAERKKCILGHEKAVAFTRAKPQKPVPKVKVGAKAGCCGGAKVEAIPHYEKEIERLNDEIDAERKALWDQADMWSADPTEAKGGSVMQKFSEKSSITGQMMSSLLKNKKQNIEENSVGDLEVNVTEDSNEADDATLQAETPSFMKRADDDADAAADAETGVPATAAPEQSKRADKEEPIDELGDTVHTTGGSVKPHMSSTAFVTFTSLRAKQSAVQCELSGKIDHLEPFAAPEPAGVIWENLPVPLTVSKHAQKVVGVFWTIGVLFWAVPVSFVTSIANLNGILTAVGLDPMNETSFLYGLIAGLLPVIFLAILMAVLYIAIGMSAAKVIRKKSLADVDAYTFYWHMLYQFANLWLILIGGSAFNQMDALIEDPMSIASILASAMPGASTFFINIIIVQSLAVFGKELSQLVPYILRAVLNKFVPEVGRTQRTLDEGAKPIAIKWGKQLPPMVFIFLVSLVYLTITPIVELFACVYFGGHYLVWAHNCLHVYAQEFEGGGKPVWENLSSFMFVCLYMSEFVFFAYLGIKEAPGPAVVGIIALVGTVVVHLRLRRNVIKPLANLALEVAANVDIDEGELEVSEEERGLPYGEAVEKQLYGQPSLKGSMDEREPMPYRRDEVAAKEEDKDEESGVEGGLGAGETV